MKNEDIYLTMSDIARPLLEKFSYPYEVLTHIKEYILELGNTLSDDYILRGENVWIHKSARVDETAHIDGPAIIGEETEIRHCAFVRGSVIIGKRCVLGNSCEIKNSILMDDVQVPHFNYVGDSIFGNHAHTGAGVIVSNLKSDKTNVTIKYGEERVETGLRKVGAFLGDNVEVGCNSVLNPGTIIGPNSRVYPLTSVRGYVPSDSIAKKTNEIVARKDV